MHEFLMDERTFGFVFQSTLPLSSNGTPSSLPAHKNAPLFSAFLGSSLKRSSGHGTASSSSSKPLLCVRAAAQPEEPKTKKVDRWAGLGNDISDDQQDITRGKGMVDSLFQGAVGLGTQHAVMSSYDYISQGQRL